MLYKSLPALRWVWGWLQRTWQHYWFTCTSPLLTHKMMSSFVLSMQKHLNLVPAAAFLFLSVFVYLLQQQLASCWQHEIERGHAAQATCGVCVKSLEKKKSGSGKFASLLHPPLWALTLIRSPLMRCTLSPDPRTSLTKRKCSLKSFPWFAMLVPSSISPHLWSWAPLLSSDYIFSCLYYLGFLLGVFRARSWVLTKWDYPVYII